MTAGLLRRWWRLPHAERAFASHVWLLLPLCQAALGWVALDTLLARRVRLRGAARLTRGRALAIVEGVAAIHPCRPRCLARVVVGRWVLRRLGVRTEVVIGCARKEPFEAHAWLRAGGATLMGDPAGSYRELHVFADIAE